MRIFQRFLAVIGLATACVAAPASATTIFLDEAHYSPPALFGGISYTPLSLTFGGEAGRFAFTGRNAQTNDPFSVLSYCLDFTRTLTGGNFELGAISSFLSNTTKQQQLAALLRNTNPLFATTNDVSLQSRIAASVALGVWEIVFEAGVGGYSVANGDFSTFGDFVDIQAQADSYLAAVLNGPVGNANDIGALVAFDNQSQVFLVGGGAGGGVPEPATWAMMMLGFGMIGAALRRRGWQASQKVSCLLNR
ncbi:MAG: PEPxxWA-CTERM sorting domain-containing protein [Pseudomonadota bacterium]